MWQLLKRKAVWIPLLIVAAVAGLVFYLKSQAGKPQYTTEAVKRQDLRQTVAVTGTVEAAEEIKLNFKVTGRLTKLSAKVGQQVKAGLPLATLDTRDAQAAILTAQASLKSTQASLDKLKAGAQTEDVAVTQSSVEAAKVTLANARESLDNTKASQAQAVANAWAQLVGLPPVAIPGRGNTSTATLSISGTYSGSGSGIYTIRLEGGSSLTYSVFGLENLMSTDGSRNSPSSLGTRGLKLQFGSTGSLVAGDTWTVEVPNTSSVSYATYQAAYDATLTTQKQQVDAAEAAVRAAEQALAQAEAQLALKQAPPRSYDIQSAEAAVDSARASLIRAQADFADRTIIAPVAGLVTQVNYEVGETTSLTTPVVVLLAEGNHEIKVQVPEADIVKLKGAQLADITLDAFGSAEHFGGHISFIDPAANEIQDVVYYQVTVLFDANDERIKPGMTANVDVTTAERQNVLVVPLRAVKYQGSQAYAEVLKDGEPQRRDLSVGLSGDDGLVEVLSGLGEGEQAITVKINGK